MIDKKKLLKVITNCKMDLAELLAFEAKYYT